MIQEHLVKVKHKCDAMIKTNQVQSTKKMTQASKIDFKTI